MVFRKNSVKKMVLNRLTEKAVAAYVDELKSSSSSANERQAIDDIINHISQLEYKKEILTHPLFLSYCLKVRNKDKGIKYKITTGEPFELFEYFCSEWITRERRRNEVNVGQLSHFMEEMAIELGIRPENTISDEVIPDMIAQNIKAVTKIVTGEMSLEGEEIIDEEERKASVCSFINVVGQLDGMTQYRFSLRSFGSYFVALRVLEELNASTLDFEKISLGRIELSTTDIHMIDSAIRCHADVKKVKKNLLSLINITSSSFYSNNWPYYYLGGNAATIYAILCGNIKKPRLELDFSGISLSGLKIDNGILSGTWKNIDLRNTTIMSSDVTGLHIENIYVANTEIEVNTAINISTSTMGIYLNLEQASKGEGELSHTITFNDFVWVPPRQNFSFQKKKQILGLLLFMVSSLQSLKPQRNSLWNSHRSKLNSPQRIPRKLQI